MFYSIAGVGVVVNITDGANQPVPIDVIAVDGQLINISKDEKTVASSMMLK